MTYDLLALKNASPEKLRLADLSPETREKIAVARSAGKSLRAIAADFDLSHGSVQRLLKKEGMSGPVASSIRMPRRPRNGQAALPDFQKLAKMTAKGKTVKEVWRAYAQETPKAYCYTHFSTLFRHWLEENKLTAPSGKGTEKKAALPLSPLFQICRCQITPPRKTRSRKSTGRTASIRAPEFTRFTAMLVP